MYNLKSPSNLCIQNPKHKKNFHKLLKAAGMYYYWKTNLKQHKMLKYFETTILLQILTTLDTKSKATKVKNKQMGLHQSD